MGERRTQWFPSPLRKGRGQGEGSHENMPTGRSFPLTPTLSPSAGERENRTTGNVCCLLSQRLLSKRVNRLNVPPRPSHLTQLIY